mmetsp:Transcript_63530/g.189314  ORF Transcript_63530/g.189314 Transcript_63530/m.189314 type:complete len:233 (-) Transcript_63530:631-1329(-)
MEQQIQVLVSPDTMAKQTSRRSRAARGNVHLGVTAQLVRVHPFRVHLARSCQLWVPARAAFLVHPGNTASCLAGRYALSASQELTQRRSARSPAKYALPVDIVRMLGAPAAWCGRLVRLARLGSKTVLSPKQMGAWCAPQELLTPSSDSQDSQRAKLARPATTPRRAPRSACRASLGHGVVVRLQFASLRTRDTGALREVRSPNLAAEQAPTATGAALRGLNLSARATSALP